MFGCWKATQLDFPYKPLFDNHKKWLKVSVVSLFNCVVVHRALHASHVMMQNWFSPLSWFIALLKVVVPSQVAVRPGPVWSVMWSRMKALCQNCLVSKHSTGSSTHTVPRLLMLVLGLHRCVCVCFMHAWPADIHLCELPSLSQTGHSTSSWLPNPPLE